MSSKSNNSNVFIVDEKEVIEPRISAFGVVRRLRE
jgi:hypothetical protein